MAIKRKYVQRKEDPQPRKEKGGKDVKGGVEVVPAGEFLQGELKTYGEMTVQNRAIPSLSDGLIATRSIKSLMSLKVFSCELVKEDV
jgi:hypothetical protein